MLDRRKASTEEATAKARAVVPRRRAQPLSTLLLAQLEAVLQALVQEVALRLEAVV